MKMKEWKRVSSITIYAKIEIRQYGYRTVDAHGAGLEKTEEAICVRAELDGNMFYFPQHEGDTQEHMCT